jgi:hypothetical protein
MARLFRLLGLLVAFVALFAVALLTAQQKYSTGSSSDVVHLAAGTRVGLDPGAIVNLSTPAFLEVGKRYAFTWPGGGPPQTHVVKAIRPDGWVLVDVADDNTRTELYIPGEFPTRWIHAAIAVSIQEMRPLQ